MGARFFRPFSPFLIFGIFRLDKVPRMIIIEPSRLTERVFRKAPKAERERRLRARDEAAAVERREGARAYVTGAQGHPRKVFRCSLVSSRARRIDRGGSGGAPRVRRSAPAPSRRSAPSGDPEGLILRCSTAQRSSLEGRKARIEAVASHTSDRRDGRSVVCLTS